MSELNFKIGVAINGYCVAGFILNLFNYSGVAMASEQDRAQLISIIWSLKTAISKKPQAIDGVSFVHFNTLLRDDDYRVKILTAAARSTDTEISQLAQQALDLNIPGTLVRKPQEAEAPARQPAQQASAMRQELQNDKRGFSPPNWAIWAGLFALVVVAGGFILAGLNFDQAPKEIRVSGSITENTVWKAETLYKLDGLVFVEAGATLSIEAGTLIQGEERSALIVTRDGLVNAQGTKENPIIFTSAKPVGQRARGNWGGVVLLGNAPVNTKVGHIEGVQKSDPRGGFGGNAASSSCGVLKYVRIEFAGYEISKDNELNGLTLGGCGEGTILSHIQVHMGLDDGIEFFGGSANLQYTVISRPGDDGLDWDRGWTGNGQFIVVQQGRDDGDNCIEADNYKKDKNAQPRSRPTLSNVTLVSSRDPNIAQRGILLRRGTGVDLRNALVSGFTKEALDVRDTETVALTKTGELAMDAVIFAHPPTGGEFFGSEAGEKDDDGGFSEETWFKTTSSRNQLTFDRVLGPLAYAETSPNFAPPTSSIAGKYFAPIPQGEFWEEGANYAGALRPGVSNEASWLSGWTSFPAN